MAEGTVTKSYVPKEDFEGEISEITFNRGGEDEPKVWDAFPITTDDSVEMAFLDRHPWLDVQEQEQAPTEQQTRQRNQRNQREQQQPPADNPPENGGEGGN